MRDTTKPREPYTLRLAPDVLEALEKIRGCVPLADVVRRAVEIGAERIRANPGRELLGLK